MMKEKALYITRCDIGWYSKNANAYRKPIEMATKYDATIFASASCRVPEEIAVKCRAIVRFRHVRDILAQSCHDAEMQGNAYVFTGFDFPSMYIGWRLKRRYGCRWTVFLWDPPSLSHRDRFPPLRWAIDALFRFFAKRCDKLVLNIHPGLLDEIGFSPRAGQAEFRMQDAWEGVEFKQVQECDKEDFEYDFGVLSNWESGKGADLMTAAMKQMPDKRCLWIGNPPAKRDAFPGIHFSGRLQQETAFERLRRCRWLVVPYLPTHALKWNYPLKLFEYLELGRPIVASDNPGNAAVAKLYADRVRLFRSGDLNDFIRIVNL